MTDRPPTDRRGSRREHPSHDGGPQGAAESPARLSKRDVPLDVDRDVAAPAGWTRSALDWYDTVRTAQFGARRRDVEEDARRDLDPRRPLRELTVPRVAEDRGNGVIAHWDLPHGDPPQLALVEVHDPDRQENAARDARARALRRTYVNVGDLSVNVVAGLVALVCVVAAMRVMPGGVWNLGVLAVAVGGGYGVPLEVLRQVTEAHWRTIELPIETRRTTGAAPDLTTKIERLVEAHGLATAGGGDRVLPALATGAARQLLWDTAGALAATPRDPHEHDTAILATLKGVDDLRDAARQIPPPIANATPAPRARSRRVPRAPDRTLEHVRAALQLERSDSADTLVQDAIDGLRQDRDDHTQ